jgi:hypothetical protein
MNGTTRRRTLLLYWGSIATGTLLPLAMELGVAMARRGQTLAQFFDGFFVRLFAPQESVVMLTVLGGAPFLLFGVLALIHLGTADRVSTELGARRQFSLQLTYVAMLALSVWGHYSIMTARGSTAGLGFLFLPFVVAATGLAAYGLGRGFKRLRRGPAGQAH